MASHDFEVLNTTCNRVIEVTSNGSFDRINSTYEEYVNDQDVQNRLEALYNA